MRGTSEKESGYYEMLGHAIDGFKELKLNRKKRSDYADALNRVGEMTKRLKIRTGFGMVTASMFGQAFFYILIGIVVFVLAGFGHVSSDVIIKVTAAVLFMTGPITAVVTTIPTFLRAGVAVENIYSLEGALDNAVVRPEQDRPLKKSAGLMKFALTRSRSGTGSTERPCSDWNLSIFQCAAGRPFSLSEATEAANPRL